MSAFIKAILSTIREVTFVSINERVASLADVAMKINGPFQWIGILLLLIKYFIQFSRISCRFFGGIYAVPLIRTPLVLK